MCGHEQIKRSPQFHTRHKTAKPHHLVVLLCLLSRPKLASNLSLELSQADELRDGGSTLHREAVPTLDLNCCGFRVSVKPSRNDPQTLPSASHPANHFAPNPKPIQASTNHPNSISTPPYKPKAPNPLRSKLKLPKESSFYWTTFRLHLRPKSQKPQRP